MRKELEYRKADRDKIERAKDLIEQIASPGEDEKTVQAALNELGELTGDRKSTRLNSSHR